MRCNFTYLTEDDDEEVCHCAQYGEGFCYIIDDVENLRICPCCGAFFLDIVGEH